MKKNKMVRIGIVAFALSLLVIFISTVLETWDPNTDKVKFMFISGIILFAGGVITLLLGAVSLKK